MSIREYGDQFNPGSIYAERERIQQRWGLVTGVTSSIASYVTLLFVSGWLTANMSGGEATPIRIGMSLGVAGYVGLMGYGFGRNPIGEWRANVQYPLPGRRTHPPILK